ncbi:AAA family ATPase [Butyricimonas hominis]|uniref:AAA family ATPase n=1 Tax=Butyricimonas hominis TaxID=2763032 RepID=UPI003516C2E5
MRKLPVGIQTFEKIRRENFLYVDKTALMWQIAAKSAPCFLSRPRRFGITK